MSINKELRFMRFVVRPDCKGGIVGINHHLFEEGEVYEVREIFDGEFSIKKLGKSPLGVPLGHSGSVFFNNGMDYNRLYAENGGNLVRTIEEHKGSVKAKEEHKIVEVDRVFDLAPFTSVRVDFGDEISWGEYVGDGVFMSINNTLSNVQIKAPLGHANNGKSTNMRWGHFFVGRLDRAHVLQPLFIVGHFDEVRCAIHKGDNDSSKRCHRCQRYAFLINNPARSDADEEQLKSLGDWLQRLHKDPGWTPVARGTKLEDDPTIIP